MATLARASLTTAERDALERAVTALEAELGADLLAVWMYRSGVRGAPARGLGHRPAGRGLRPSPERPRLAHRVRRYLESAQSAQQREGADYDGLTFEREQSEAHVADARRFLEAVERLVRA